MKVLFAALFILLSVVSPVFAQEETIAPEAVAVVADDAEVVTTSVSEGGAEEVAPDQSAPVTYSNFAEIVNGVRVETAPHTFDISFELASYRSVVGNVKVGAALTSVNNETGQVTIVHESVLNSTPYVVGPDNSPVAAQFTYTAPAYLTGTYTLLLFSRTPQGVIESMFDLGQIELEGSVVQVITPDSCVIALSETELIPRTEIIKSAPGDNFELRCILKNTTSQSVTVTPEVTQHTKGQYGEVTVPTQVLAPISLAAGEERQIPLPVVAATVPSSYYVMVDFKNSDGDSQGGVPFRYTVVGTWAYLSTASLDYTEAGEVTANAKIVMSDTTLYPLSVETTITDAAQACTFTAAASITQGEAPIVTIPFTSIRDCIPRTISFTLKDSEGTVRDTLTLTQLAAGELAFTVPESIPLTQQDVNAHPYRLLIIVTVLAIAAVIGIAYSKRRRLATNVVGTLMFAAVMFFGASEAMAVSSGPMYYTCPVSGPCPVATNIYMSVTNPPVSVPAGSTFSVTARVWSDDVPLGSNCPYVGVRTTNAAPMTDMYQGACATESYHTANFTVTRTLTAPSTVGTHSYCARFENGGYNSPPLRCMTYTVTSGTNAAPVVNAGIDRIINLPTSTITPSGQSAVDSDGTIATRLWTFVSGPATPSIAGATGANPTFSGMTTAGTYTFRYAATDDDGASASDTMRVVVLDTPPPPPPSGTPPETSAGADRVITLPIDDVSPSGQYGFDEDGDGPVTSIVWSRVSGPSVPVITGATTLTPVFTDLVEGTYVFQLVVRDSNGNSVTDQMTVTVNPAVVIPPPNTPPTVTLITPYTVTLPTNTVVTSGNTATDSDGTIANISWTKTAGGAATVTNGTTMNPTFSGLVAGTYFFRVDVHDDDGAVTSRILSVVVNPDPSPNANPIISAGPDITITLPTNTANPTGQSATDSDGTIASTVWSRVSGPAATITGATTMTPTFNVPTAGTYMFRFTVTDNEGGVSTDDVQVVVNPVPSASLSVAACAIALNQETCNGRSTWNLSAGIAPYSLRNTTNGYVVGSSAVGTDVATRMVYGVNTVQARDAASIDITQTVSVACATNLFYHSALSPAVCKNPPVITPVDPSDDVMWIRSGEQAEIAFTVTADYEARCTISGGVPPGTTVTHNGSALFPTSSHTGIQTVPLTSAQTVTVTCEAVSTPSIPTSRSVEELTVNVVPIIEEI